MTVSFVHSPPLSVYVSFSRFRGHLVGDAKVWKLKAFWVIADFFFLCKKTETRSVRTLCLINALLSLSLSLSVVLQKSVFAFFNIVSLLYIFSWTYQDTHEGMCHVRRWPFDSRWRQWKTVEAKEVAKPVCEDLEKGTKWNIGCWTQVADRVILTLEWSKRHKTAKALTKKTHRFAILLFVQKSPTIFISLPPNKP